MGVGLALGLVKQRLGNGILGLPLEDGCMICPF